MRIEASLRVESGNGNEASTVGQRLPDLPKRDSNYG